MHQIQKPKTEEYPDERLCTDCDTRFSKDGEGHSYAAIQDFDKCVECLGYCPYCNDDA